MNHTPAGYSGFILTQKSALRLGNAYLCCATSHSGHRHGHHGLHFLVLCLRLLLHVVSCFIDSAVENEEDDQGNPEITDNQSRIERRVFDELSFAFSWQQVAVSNKVLPTENGYEEQ